MRRLPVIAVSIVASVALAACAPSTGSVAPDATAPSATEAPTGAPASAEPRASAASGTGDCDVSTEAGTVRVEIDEFEFRPAAISAPVGETILFTNVGARAHTATLHDNSCDVDLDPGTSGGLVFDGPGVYAFHCSIHQNMTGLITIG